MNWADRIAIIWAAFITFCVAFMWIGAGEAGGLIPVLFSLNYILLLAKLVLPPWLFLRVIAWAFGSHGARRT